MPHEPAATIAVAGSRYSISRDHRGTMKTHRRNPKYSSRGNILMFDKAVALDLQNKVRRRTQRQLTEVERMSAISRTACSISHDMRHSLTAIYANAEFLERHDTCASARAD